MLTLLKIKNIALIDELNIEFGGGLNLLTGETGSGKSIIVDSLSALTGERVFSDIIKDGEQAAKIEGLFSIKPTPNFRSICEEAGIELEDADEIDLIVRRELSLAGRNRIFINDQLVTSALLKKIGFFLVDIHGQGEHAALFDPATHLKMLDNFANLKNERDRTAEAYDEFSSARKSLAVLKTDEAEKLQLLDILRFQVDEISRAAIQPEEDKELEEEKKRLNNVEKLSTLSAEAYSLLYESDESTLATLEKATRRIEELSEYKHEFGEYIESLKTALAVIEDLSITTRDFRNHLEFSPARLEEIENRLAEISRLTRKYGGSVESVLRHLADSRERLERIETSELSKKELREELRVRRANYLEAAAALTRLRTESARKFEKAVETNLAAVALEKAKFEVRIESPGAINPADDRFDKLFTAKGFDRIEFYFSANAGESAKPLAKVASGGEASRLMLILKTTAKSRETRKSAVFDEIDAGIGGRVAEAVGIRLKELAKTQQVLCVTHQPQIASKADRHFVVEKYMTKDRTTIVVRELDKAEQIDEVARMLAGETITHAARENAREMIAGTK